MQGDNLRLSHLKMTPDSFECTRCSPLYTSCSYLYSRTEQLRTNMRRTQKQPKNKPGMKRHTRYLPNLDQMFVLPSIHCIYTYAYLGCGQTQYFTRVHAKQCLNRHSVCDRTYWDLLCTVRIMPQQFLSATLKKPAIQTAVFDRH